MVRGEGCHAYLMPDWVFAPNYENGMKHQLKHFHYIYFVFFFGFFFFVIFSRVLCVFPLDLRPSCISFGSVCVLFFFRFFILRLFCVVHNMFQHLLLLLGGTRQLPALLRHKPHTLIKYTRMEIDKYLQTPVG